MCRSRGVTLHPSMQACAHPHKGISKLTVEGGSQVNQQTALGDLVLVQPTRDCVKIAVYSPLLTAIDEISSLAAQNRTVYRSLDGRRQSMEASSRASTLQCGFEAPASNLASLPAVLHAEVVRWLPSPLDVASFDCTSRLFHVGTPRSAVEEGLRLRAEDAGRAVEAALPAGETSWTQWLLFHEAFPRLLSHLEALPRRRTALRRRRKPI